MPKIPQDDTKNDKRGEIEFCEKMQEQNMSVLLKEIPKPLIVFYQGGGHQATKEMPYVPTPKLVVKILAPFRYASDKAEPWNYTSQTVTPESQVVTKQRPEKSVIDIAGTRGMTRSGRFYAPVTIKVREGESSVENEGVKIAASKKKDKEPINEPVTKMEADEFLKFIKHNEYSIVE